MSIPDRVSIAEHDLRAELGAGWDEAPIDEMVDEVLHRYACERGLVDALVRRERAHFPHSGVMLAYCGGLVAGACAVGLATYSTTAAFVAGVAAVLVAVRLGWDDDCAGGCS